MKLVLEVHQVADQFVIYDKSRDHGLHAVGSAAWRNGAYCYYAGKSQYGNYPDYEYLGCAKRYRFKMFAILKAKQLEARSEREDRRHKLETKRRNATPVKVWR